MNSTEHQVSARVTSAGWILALVGLMSLLASFFNSPLRPFLTLLAVAAFTPFFTALGLSASASGVKHVEVTVEPSDAVVPEGSEVHVNVRVRSSVFRVGRVSRALLVADPGADVTLHEVRLLSDDYIELSFRVTGRLGKHSLGPLFLRLAVLGGVTVLETSLNVAAQVRVAPTSLRMAAHLAPPGARYVGTTPAGVSGAGTGFLMIREYFPGDDTRRIDWKAFARTGKLAIKLFEKESSQGVILGVAIHDGFFRGRPSAFEVLARELASLASSLIKAGLWVRLAVSTEYGVIIGEKASSPSTISNVFQVLASIEWPKEPSHAVTANRVLGWLIREVLYSTQASPSVIVVAVLDVVDESDLTMLALLKKWVKAQGHEFIVIATPPPVLRIAGGDRDLSNISEARKSVTQTRRLSQMYGVDIIATHSLNVALRKLVTARA